MNTRYYKTMQFIVSGLDDDRFYLHYAYFTGLVASNAALRVHALQYPYTTWHTYITRMNEWNHMPSNEWKNNLSNPDPKQCTSNI